MIIGNGSRARWLMLYLICPGFSGCATSCQKVDLFAPVIAFQSDRSGTEQIYTIHPDGTALTRLTNDDAHDEQPMASAGGLRVAFVSSPTPAGYFDLWTIFGNGQGAAPLIPNQKINARGGHWSPYGSDIAFSGTFESSTDGPNIFLVVNDGTNLRQLTRNAGANIEPSFSPDGKRLLFTSTRTGVSNIYSMNKDGSDVIQLTNSPGANAEATFSPDGKQIVFWSDRDGNGELYIMNADGSQQTNLTSGPGFDFEPVFSPDSREVAFSSQRDGKNWQLYIINVDSKVVRRLTNDLAVDRAPDWH